jgi:hypothetical protein
MSRYFILAIALAALFLIALIAPAHAAFFYSSGWSGGWNSGWTGSGFTYVSGPAWHSVNYHNQWVAWPRVTPVGTFSSVAWTRSAHPMHFGYFSPAFVSW